MLPHWQHSLTVGSRTHTEPERMPSIHSLATHPRGPTDMAQSADQYRIAITVFDDADALFDVIVELLRAGLRQEQLCIAARRETLSAWDTPRRLPDADLAQIAALQRSTTALTFEGGDVAVVRGGATLLKVVASDQASGGAGLAHPTDAGGLWPGLMNHIRNGATVLVVRSTSAAQQAASTRMLLSISQQRVQTYEFRATFSGAHHTCHCGK